MRWNIFGRGPNSAGLRLAWCLAGAIPACTLAAQTPPPVAAFFGNPALGTVALSRTGRYLAVTVPGQHQRLELRVADLDRSPWQFKGVGWLRDYDIARVHWLNDQRLLFDAFDAQAGAWAGTTGLWAVDADGENGKLLIDAEYAGFRTVSTPGRNILSGEWELHAILPGGGDDVLVRQWHWSAIQGNAWTTLARLNTHVAQPRLLTSGAPDGATHWVTDDAGEPRFMAGWRDGHNHVYQRVGAGWSDIAEADDLDARAWSPAFMVGDQLLVSAHLGGAEASQLVPYDSARRQPAELPVLSSKGFDVGDTAIALVDDADRQPLGWRYRLDTVYTRWTDPMMAGMQAAIDKALPGRVNVIECHVCRGAKRWLVRSLADNQPPTYAVFEPASGRLTPVGLAYPDLPADRMGTRSFQRIPTRDGLDMPVYVTTPAQGQPGPKPAVVYVHGGPWSRVNLEWGDHWADSVPQFLASRGYVVIEPEFRGSTGYGHAHFEAGRGQWGLAMQDDLSDALKWAVNKGWVDAGRVCIMGASYGGYAALMGPVQAPGSYRCAISAVGVTDLPGILEDNKQHVSRNHQGFRFEKRHIGDPDKDRAQLERNSPLHRVADIQVPVLAAWGKDDQRVKLDQGRRFRDAASKAHLALEYVEYADEGHNWLKPETRIDFYTRAEKLLARTIGAASDATK